MSEELGFTNAHSIGELGETLFMEIENHYGYDVYDVSDNPQYFGQDIDFIVNQNGRTITYEIKTDRAMNKWGNLFLESVIEFTDNRKPQFIKGWIRKSKAERLIYIDAEVGWDKGKYTLDSVRHVYFCNLPKLVAWANSNDTTMSVGVHKDTMTKGEHKGRPYIAYGFRARVEDLKSNGILKEFDYNKIK